MTALELPNHFYNQLNGFQWNSAMFWYIPCYVIAKQKRQVKHELSRRNKKWMIQMHLFTSFGWFSNSCRVLSAIFPASTKNVRHQSINNQRMEREKKHSVIIISKRIYSLRLVRAAYIATTEIHTRLIKTLTWQRYTNECFVVHNWWDNSKEFLPL